MKCRDVEKMVQSYIDDDLSPKELEAFISHVNNCPSCYEELEIHFIIQHAIRYLDEDEHSNFDMKGLLTEDLKRKWKQVKRRKAAKMVAVCLGLLLIIAILAILGIWLFPDNSVVHLFYNNI